MVKQAVAVAKGNGGAALGGGAVAAGIKEAIDFVFRQGLSAPWQHPDLYELLTLDGVDAGIMALITACVIWVVRGQKR